MSGRLVLGSAALGLAYGLPRSDGRSVDEATVGGLLRSLSEADCLAIDSAPAYGSAEERIGRHLVAPLPIWTKLDQRCRPGPELRERMTASVAASLTRLRRARLDLVQWHNWSADLLDDQDWLLAWEGLRDDPRVAALGCSTYGLADALAAVRCGCFTRVQVEWNPFRQGVVAAIADEALARGVHLAVRSVLLQGVLADPAGPLPAHLASLAEPRTRLAALASGLGLDLAGLCLRAALSLPAVDAVLVGARDHGEWRQAVARAGDQEARPDLVAAIRAWDRGEDPLVDPRTWPPVVEA
jgi:aryl-alcohol dehydrogenase-like predicted oxidoreductase